MRLCILHLYSTSVALVIRARIGESGLCHNDASRGPCAAAAYAADPVWLPPVHSAIRVK